MNTDESGVAGEVLSLLSLFICDHPCSSAAPLFDACLLREISADFLNQLSVPASAPCVRCSQLPAGIQ